MWVSYCMSIQQINVCVHKKISWWHFFISFITTTGMMRTVWLTSDAHYCFFLRITWWIKIYLSLVQETNDWAHITITRLMKKVKQQVRKRIFLNGHASSKETSQPTTVPYIRPERKENSQESVWAGVRHVWNKTVVRIMFFSSFSQKVLFCFKVGTMCSNLLALFPFVTEFLFYWLSSMID